MDTLFLVAQVAERRVAIPAEQVESVVDIGRMTPVPAAEATIRGLAALRSRVVTVIDSCAALGLPDRRSDTCRAVITQVDGHPYAVLVDSVEDVAPYAIEPLSGEIGLEGGWREAGRGIVDLDGEPILAIDLRALVPGLTVTGEIDRTH